MQVLSFTQNSRDELRLLGGDGEVAASIMAESGTHQSTYVAVLGAKRRRRETWAWDTKYSSSRHGCFKGNREFITTFVGSAYKETPMILVKQIDEDVHCYENHGQDSRVREIYCAPTIPQKAGTGGNNLPVVMRVKRRRADDDAEEGA